MPFQKATTAKEGIPSIFLYDEDVRLKYPVIAGIDEAGRGPLAGPVVAAAVILPSGGIIKGLRDSKEVAEKVRKRVFWDIVNSAVDIGVGIVNADLVDKINILNSTKAAMEMAVRGLMVRADFLLIDAVKLPSINIRQDSIIRGESVSASIASASIVAKVVRDEIMLNYHEKYPLYNFKKHKGYSTKEHIELIRLHGPCPIHRKSFKKVMDRALSFNA